jgi:hypothetical protein
MPPCRLRRRSNRVRESGLRLRDQVRAIASKCPVPQLTVAARYHSQRGRILLQKSSMRPEVVRLAWVVVGLAVAVLLLQRLASVLVPFCAAALSPTCVRLVAWLQNKRVPRLLAVMVVMSVAVLVVVGLMLVVIPTWCASECSHGTVASSHRVVPAHRCPVGAWRTGCDLPANAERARMVAAMRCRLAVICLNACCLRLPPAGWRCYRCWARSCCCRALVLFSA